MTSCAESEPIQPEPERHYNPRFLTKFDTRIIELDGRQVEIHKTNSLPAVIESVIAHEINEEPKTLQDIAYRGRVVSEPVVRGAVLGFLAEETEVAQAVRSILEVREIERKDATLRLVDVSAHMSHPEHKETTEIEPIRAYYFSLAFDQIAARAWEIEPGFDLLKFVE